MADALTRYDGPQSLEAARNQVMQARLRLSFATRGLKADFKWLKVPLAVTASIKRSPLIWLGGALVVGAALGLLSGRNRGDE
ncbi:MAG: hypothetical protein JNK82_25105 [Myxococcaceae bacterium]|nr:hypothetical protein [Myxococcaceae bacterium]